MEVRVGRLLDDTSFMAQHRVGARGNALTFPLPWEELLGQLNDVVDDDYDTADVLPRAGAELAHVWNG